MNKNREGFGWMELILLVLTTCIPVWLHFESKSWDGASEAPMMFLFIIMAGVLMCIFVASSMILHRYANRSRYEHNDVSPDDWRDDRF